MDYSCPECKTNLRYKYIKSRFYKNPKASFSLGFSYICPSCNTEIIENENKKSNTSKAYFSLLLPLAYSFGTIYVMSYSFSRDEALSLVFVISLFVIFITNKLFVIKLPKEWQYWRKNIE